MNDNLKQKILAATRDTKFGAIIRCAMNIERDAVPRFFGKATVTSDGFIMCSFVDSDGIAHMGAFVGSKENVLMNVRGLSRHLRMTYEEHEELANLIDAWMGIEIMHVTNKTRREIG